MDPALTDFVNKFVADEHLNEFGPIQRSEVKFACAYILRSTNEGEAQPTKGDVVTVKKVGTSDRVFMDYHYKLYFDHSRWSVVDETRQRAVLHKALMRVNVTATEAGGIKFGTRAPDISEFQATVARFGPWTDELRAFKANLQAAADAKNAHSDDVTDGQPDEPEAPPARVPKKARSAIDPLGLRAAAHAAAG